MVNHDDTLRRRIIKKMKKTFTASRIAEEIFNLGEWSFSFEEPYLTVWKGDQPLMNAMAENELLLISLHRNSVFHDKKMVYYYTPGTIAEIIRVAAKFFNWIQGNIGVTIYYGTIVPAQVRI